MNLRASSVVFTLCVFFAACSNDPTSSKNNIPAQDMGADEQDMVGEVDQSADTTIDPNCACPTPPSASCQDGQSVKTYESPGCDASNVCLSSEFIEKVEACDAPPEASCLDAQTVVTYNSVGSCEGGVCAYESTESACEPKADECIDASNLRRFIGTPSCEDGACAYTEQIEDCGDVGCCEDGCCAPEVSNVEAYGTPRSTGIVTGPPNGAFNTLTDCTQGSILGECVDVSVEGTSNACVCFSDTLVINTLRISGSRALVLMASDSIEVKGTLDVSAVGQASGPGQGFEYTEESSNGFAFGGTLGSKGGRSPLDTFGAESLIPLAGGFDGQDICTLTKGGGGGGVIQLSALNKITVSGTIAANGGGGKGGQASGSTCLDGAGGGSGGGILIEAPLVEVSGAILAQGGGGGGGAADDLSGLGGEDGKLFVGLASGGSSRSANTCAIRPNVVSGAGGNGASGVDAATDGGSRDSETGCFNNEYAGAGGGGGGVGYIRINTRRGPQACLCGGDFSPAPSFGTIPYK